MSTIHISSRSGKRGIEELTVSRHEVAVSDRLEELCIFKTTRLEVM